MKFPMVVLVLVGVGGAAALALRSFSPDTGAAAGAATEASFTATRGDLIVTLVENGELVAKEAQKLSTGTDSSGKITFLIEEGRAVGQGEVLARLDTTDLETNVQEMELEMSRTQADLASARTELEIQQTDNAANREKTGIALAKAQQELDRYRDGDAPSERRKLEVAIKEAETNYSRLKKKAEDSRLLFDKTYISRSQLEQDDIEFERATVQLEGARIDLEMFEKYTLPMTMREREVSVRDAERERDNAELRAESTVRNREVAVRENEQRLKMQTERLEKMRSEVAKMTVTAPSPGIVLYGDPNEPWYRENIRLGGDVWGGMVLFTLPDLRVMQVKLKIHEADINKLKEGQSATVTMDTYPGVVLKGEVTKIASIASGADRWSRDSEVKKFDIEITLERNEELKLKPGVSSKAEIYVDTRPDVVHVPLQCVFLEEGKSWVWVLDANGVAERAEVKTGLSNDSYVEIASGLEAGRRVLLYNPRLQGAAGSSEGEEGEDAEQSKDGKGEKSGGKKGDGDSAPKAGGTDGGGGGAGEAGAATPAASTSST
ncbi:MAG: efflux RND transporter periplasmic adaptor subunit [Planctomycetota bacterium]